MHFLLTWGTFIILLIVIVIKLHINFSSSVLPQRIFLYGIFPWISRSMGPDWFVVVVRVEFKDFVLLILMLLLRLKIRILIQIFVLILLSADRQSWLFCLALWFSRIDWVDWSVVWVVVGNISVALDIILSGHNVILSHSDCALLFLILGWRLDWVLLLKLSNCIWGLRLDVLLLDEGRSEQHLLNR